MIKKATNKIPSRLQPILWSVDVNHLDIEKHKGYIIHQVLRFGSMDDLRWLFNTYGKKEIRDVFITRPTKNYFNKDFYFVKNYILGLKNINLDEDDYVTSIHGKIRPRAARSI